MKYLRTGLLCGSVFGVYTASINVQSREDLYAHAIAKSRMRVQAAMMRYGVPGAVVAVAVNGEVVWSEGLGLADVENNVPCSEDTPMRIASISKTLTAVAVAKAWQEGKLELDESIQKYVPSFPKKEVDGVPVLLTMRQLLSNTAGVRHYHFDKNEFSSKEYHIMKHYDSVTDSLKLFANDELVFAPGSGFHYSTHGWTLVSAALEAAMGQPFLRVMKEQIFQPLNMSSTREELHSPLVLHRVRYYKKDSKGRLCNAPYVDISYKWAGGGFISTATDLVKFGSALLAASRPDSINPILSADTVAKMWQKVAKMSNKYNYGWGWMIVPYKESIAGISPHYTYIGHTGATIGASSALVLALPPSSCDSQATHPHDIAVAVIFNLQETSEMFELAQNIAENFVTY